MSLFGREDISDGKYIYLTFVLPWEINNDGYLLTILFSFDRGQQQMFRRIDNGWYIDPTSDLSPLFAETNEPKRYFKELRQLLRSYTLRHAFKEAKANKKPLDTVKRLHQYLKPWLYLRQGPSKAVLMISMHKLCLFLRWCSERGDMFR